LKLKYKSYNLPFTHPFTISKGTKTHQPSLIVELEHMGVKGYGEAPAIAYYNIPVEKMIADLEAKKIFVEKFSFTSPERYWHYLHHLFPQNNFLVCALDMAGWDLYGKLRRKQLHQLWELDTAKSPLTDFTIGIDSIETMVAKMKERAWPIYKVKVGVPGDIEMVAALRKNTAAALRVDANAGWSLEEALVKIPQLKELGVELVEQPLAKDDWEGMKALYAQSPLPLIADEACVQEADVEKCNGHFHGINIKLTKCSGITPARRMITRAKELGMTVMVGCMNESSVGTAAIAQLAPLLDYVDMDGPLLLAEDAAEGVSFDFGRICYTDMPGLGIKIQPF
jgi:L-Ala-D/L-Glu epimerase